MISAVVPVFNGREDLARLLDSLDQQTLAAGEVLVIDNGSEDGAPEMAAARGARIIRMGLNAGFAAAVNRGIAEARGEWIAILNSDVRLAPDYFELLTKEDIWFATGRILSGDGKTIDGTWDLLSRGGTAYRAGNGRSDDEYFDWPRAIFSAPLTAALFRADLFRKVGLLEERLESYLEDVDLGLRSCAHQLIGVYVPAAVAWHRGSATYGRWHPEVVRRIARNQCYLLARHFSAKLLFRNAWHIVVAQMLWGAIAVRHGALRAWLRGKIEGLFGFARLRRTAVKPASAQLLRINESLIREAQRRTGYDAYWKLYFLLTRGRA